MIRLVMTGGPCAGKTTAMPMVSEMLESRGYKVFMVPEVPTTLILTGVSPCEELPEDDFECLILEKQVSDEDVYSKAATHWGDDTIVVYDRGIPDILPYVGDERYAEMLAEYGITPTSVYDRYDFVIHLTSAAIGAEEHYGWNDPESDDTSNNAARRTSLESAKKEDTETLRSWSGHPNLRVIDNSTGFEEKMERLMDAIREMLELA